MKKLIRLLATIIACVVTCTSAVACTPGGGGGNTGVQLDPNKETILLNVYGGGFGTSWAVDACNTWNQSEEGQASDYQFTLFSLNGHLKTINDVSAEVANAVTQADIYFCDESDMTSLAPLASELIDLSDVWEAKPDANMPNRTVREKFFFGDVLDSIYTTKVNNQTVKFALPYTMGTSGIVYDLDLFEAMEWYFTDSNTQSGLSKGMDGVEGTYDDGLPVTVDDFQTLLNNITSATMYPFILYGTVASAGTDHVINAINAQYEGVASYINGYDYTGQIYRDGQYVEVTPQTGYKVYENLEGRANGVKFVQDYIIAKDSIGDYKYLDPSTDDINHLVSESRYIYSHDNGGRRVAMTINGAWWENEALGAFKEEELVGNPGYGERNFGFMPVPKFDGQNPDSDKAVFSVNQFGSVFAVKSADEGKNEAIKSFLTFYSSNEGLSLFTKAVGVAPGYKFEIDEDVLAGLTKFGQIYYEICNSEHTEIVAPTVFKFLSPLNYRSTSSPNRNIKISGDYKSPFEAMNRVAATKRMTAEQIIEAWNTEWNATKWGNLVTELENQGFEI